MVLPILRMPPISRAGGVWVGTVVMPIIVQDFCRILNPVELGACRDIQDCV